jgi:hypothetical protein
MFPYERLFHGNFNKLKRYIEAKKAVGYGFTVPFKEESLLNVGHEVVKHIGKKGKYSTIDAVIFFQRKYAAYRVSWEYLLQYQDTSVIRIEHYARATLGDDEMYPFDYNASGEKTVVLVFDTTLNTKLKEMYPTIDEYEKELREKDLKKRANEVVYLHPNPILVIGSFDGSEINSMFCEFNSVIQDIEYEMEYFRLHS